MTDRPDKPVPWRRLCRQLAQEPYGFSPAEVGEMTLYQIKTLLASEESLGAGTFTVDARDYGRVKAQIDADREAKGLRNGA